MSLLAEQIEREFSPKHVSIQEFAESSEYCGKQLYPRQRVWLKLMFLEEMEGWEEDILSEWIRGGKYGDVQLSPMVRERRDMMREEGRKHFYENIFVGGRRSGKGYVTSFAVAYKIWQTQQLGDPGKHYGIDPDKEIYFSSVAASLEQAKKYQFADIVSTTSRCAVLTDHLGNVQEEGFRVHTPADRMYSDQLRAKGVKVNRDWAKLRVQPLAANADTIRGSATMCIVFDEMAFMLPGESRSSADECFSAAAPSLVQFGADGMIFCNSSPATKLGKFYERWELSQELDGAQPAYPHILGIKMPSWEMYRDYHLDPQRRFRKALMVSPDWSTEGMNTDEKVVHKQEQLEEKANPETYKVEKRGEWAEVVDAYLNAVAVGRVFRPVLEEFGNHEIMSTSAHNYAYAPYVGHCDPSSTTAGFGFALGHVELFPDPNFPDGYARHVVFDTVKRWNPAEFPGSTIDYKKVNADLLQYIEWFRPSQLTFDQFNSDPIMQWIRPQMQAKRLHETRVFKYQGTNAQNWQKWETLKTAINLGLVHIPIDLPDSEYAQLELKFLQKKDGQTPKVDKQTIGPVQTKDIADCIRDVVYILIGTFLADHIESLSSASISAGSPGGYQMGGRQEQGPRSLDTWYSENKRGNSGFGRARGRGRGF